MSVSEQKRILVTGNRGFIGSYLCAALAKRGFEIVGFDLGDAWSSISCQHFDHIYHLAHPVGVDLIMNATPSVFTDIIDLHARIIQKANEDGSRLFLASSSEVYGKSMDGKPMREDQSLMTGSTLEKRWNYARAKLIMEQFALDRFRNDGLDVRIARFFNVCGSGQRGAKGFVIPRFVEQAKNNLPITIFGNGDQKRSFTWVQDAVSIITAWMELESTPHRIMNVGNPNNAISLLKLAKRIRELAESSSSIHFVERTRKEITDVRIPNIVRLQSLKLIGKMYSLDDILTNLIADTTHKKSSKKISELL